MNAIERLKRDHGLLRSKLDIIERVLEMGSSAWYVLHELSFTLARQLQDHLKREEALVVACRRYLPPHVLAEVSSEHHDEPIHLRTINHLFISQAGHSLDRIRPILRDVIRGLRHHMGEEETHLFPLLERLLTPQQALIGGSPPPSSRLDETMTVNHVVRMFPGTRRVFERLFINPVMEGCTCLDEVAWRHGLDGRQLLSLLEEAVPPPTVEEIMERPPASTGRETLHETVAAER